ncbi:MAG: hypothetical protein IPK82_31700 [Polyangiaceae bacterium]|nr:hypothetical protein [Polyangiaceae bacterium]
MVLLAAIGLQPLQRRPVRFGILGDVYPLQPDKPQSSVTLRVLCDSVVKSRHRHPGASGLSLGDAHNFGRRVTRRDEWVEKPRTTVWEELFLGAESPLLQLLDNLAVEQLGTPAFSFLPRLQFKPSETPTSRLVESVHLQPFADSKSERVLQLAEIAGRFAALFSWFGVADLHWENLVLGQDHHGEIVFAPLDVEMVLDEFTLPTQTKFLPESDPDIVDICRHSCGARRLLPFIGKPVNGKLTVAMAAAYYHAFRFLNRNAQNISRVISSLPTLQTAPIRVLLRGTDEYVFSGKKDVWPPLLEAEKLQLARGDIPYFFRLIGKKGIFYYTHPDLTEYSCLPTKGDVPQLAPLLSLAKNLNAPSRKSLLEEGIFAILGAFDNPDLTGPFEYEKLSVLFKRKHLTVTLPSGEELTSRRDLRPFVGSVYLPCSCGEVHSPFVPAVTTCNG